MTPGSRRPLAFVFVGLIALAAFLLRDALFFGRAFFERDLLYYYYAWVETFVRVVAEGSWPLRDVTSGFGQPMLANPSAQILYPPTWLHLVMESHRAFAWITLFHFALGASGAAALALRFSPSKQAAALAGALWMASGPFQSGLNLWHHFAGAVWMPWVLVFFDRLLDDPRGSRIAAAGGVFGAQILAGSADLCAMTLLLALLLMICRARDLRSAGATTRATSGAFGALAIGVALGAGMWAPATDLVRASARGRLPYEVRTEWSIHPVAAIEAALPVAVSGLPLRPEIRQEFSEGRPPFIYSLFLGPLVLPLAAALWVWPGIPSGRRWFLVIGSLGALLVAMGKFTPVYDALLFVFPPLAIFRYPSKALFPFSLLAVVSAGLGVSALQHPMARRVCGLIAAGVAVAAFWLRSDAGELLKPFLLPVAASPAITQWRHDLALSIGALVVFAMSVAIARRWPSAPSIAAWMGLAVTLTLNEGINLTVSEAVIRYRPPFLNSFADPSGSRVYAFDYLRSPARAAALLHRSGFIVPSKLPALDEGSATVIASRDALLSPIGGQWGVEYAWDGDTLGLFDTVLRDMTSDIQAASGDGLARRLRAAGVSRAVALHAEGFEALTFERAIPVAFPEALRVYRVESPLPRAFVRYGVRVMSAGEAATAVVDPGFDIDREVTIEAGRAHAAASTDPSEPVRVVERWSDRVLVDANLREPGVIVALEGYLPGWRAFVDGAPAPVRRANALFIGVEAPAGRHRVAFEYRPRSAVLGAGLSGATALGLLIAALARLRSRAD